MDEWRKTLAQVGFVPFGSFGAMRCVVEDIEAVAIDNGLGNLSVTITHVGARSATQYEVTKSFGLTSRQAAQLLVEAYERIHPEASKS